jgi:RNA polymerase sigma-70 factor (ECF subfamily)
MSMSAATAVAPARQPKVYDSPEVRTLIQQVCGGNEEAFTTLYETYYPRAVMVCQRIVTEKETAEYLANEVLTTVWLKIKKFKGDAAFSTWITRIAINASLMHLRSRKREHQMITCSLDEETNHHAYELGVRDLCLEGVADKGALRLAITALPKSLRVVFILRLVEQFTGEETSKALNIRHLTVKSRLWRARGMVKESLEKTYLKQPTNSSIVTG